VCSVFERIIFFLISLNNMLRKFYEIYMFDYYVFMKYVYTYLQLEFKWKKQYK